jgi:hypothetical protein
LITVLSVALLVGSGNIDPGSTAIAFTAVSLVTGVTFLGIGLSRDSKEHKVKRIAEEKSPEDLIPARKEP